MTTKTLPHLPLTVDLETTQVLRAVNLANRHLAELKGVSGTIPNQAILLNTLALQEAKDSSAIENIITTHDEIYKTELDANLVVSNSAKEVQRYAQALHEGYNLIINDEALTCNHIIRIQKILENNDAGFRRLPGTNLKNMVTGEIIYEPPQNIQEIMVLMNNLEKYINESSLSDIDPLIKMAIIHHQFESIHPFYDGNGRTGRIINILYLVLNKLLDIPILYLSGYIIQTKPDYYRLLQSVRETNNWEEWILYMLKGLEITAKQTIAVIYQIKTLMQKYKNGIRKDFRFYSQDLLNNLFRHPYTKIEFLEKDLKISRITANKYLNELQKAGYLEKHKIWRTNYYINRPLFELLSNL